jgi:aminoglycoside phosphotransferase (APT) family kinase protein
VSEERSSLAGLVDLPRLEAWLAANLGMVDVDITRVSSGHSNEMFKLRTPHEVCMLRRPPAAIATASASQMAREFRVLRALEGTGVPHPRALALCEDATVVGAPFLVLAWIDGFAARLPLPTPFDGDPDARREMAFSMIDALAQVGGVDWRAAGLEGFGKPEGFLERQVSRWMQQLDQYRTRDIPRLDEVASWLGAHTPSAWSSGLMHGDFQERNVMFAPDRPGRVAAVVDWDSATIGAPLLDLGWLLGLWDEPGEESPGRDESAMFSTLPGMPRRRELVDRYEDATGRDARDLPYYVVLGLFKLACIIEGSYHRWRTGRSDDPYHGRFEVRVPALVARAAAVAETGRA